MATWIQKGKLFHRQYIPADTEPSNALLLEIAQALVWRRLSYWKAFLEKLDSIHPTLPNAVINPADPAANASTSSGLPATSTPWDIGTVDENGENYTPFTAPQRNACLAYFGPWAFRVFEAVPAVKEFRQATEDMGAPAATETPAEAIARREAEARAVAVANVGDDDDEVPDA